MWKNNEEQLKIAKEKEYMLLEKRKKLIKQIADLESDIQLLEEMIQNTKDKFYFQKVVKDGLKKFANRVQSIKQREKRLRKLYRRKIGYERELLCNDRELHTVFSYIVRSDMENWLIVLELPFNLTGG